MKTEQLNRILKEVELLQSAYHNAMVKCGIDKEIISKVTKQTLTEYMKLTGF